MKVAVILLLFTVIFAVESHKSGFLQMRHGICPCNPGENRDGVPLNCDKNIELNCPDGELDIDPCNCRCPTCKVLIALPL